MKIAKLDTIALRIPFSYGGKPHGFGSLVVEIRPGKWLGKNLGLTYRADGGSEAFLVKEREQGDAKATSIVRIGTPGRNGKTSVSWHKEGMGGLVMDDPNARYFIVMHLSEFMLNQGFLWITPQLGLFSRVLWHHNVLHASEFLVFGEDRVDLQSAKALGLDLLRNEMN